MIKKIILLFFLVSVNCSLAQGVEKIFHGWWGETIWEFHLHKNGTFNRISTGHFGDTEFKGKYKIIGDTLIITKGYKNTYGTIAPKYVFDFEGKLIDTHLMQDYMESKPNDSLLTSIHRKLIMIVRNRQNVTDTLKYYGKATDNFYYDKFEDGLYYFLNNTKLLTEIKSDKIIPVTGNNLNTDGSEYFDAANRLIQLFYEGSRFSAIFPKWYDFNYYEDNSFKLKNIKKYNHTETEEEFIFEYDINDNLLKVTKQENGSISETWTVLQ
jgi:hypothetical protein